MKENNLLASVALFSELYNNESYNSITDILGEFIKGAIVNEKRWVITSTELTHLLQKVYDFKIPESVVRSTVKNKLKDIVKSVDGHYHFETYISLDYLNLDTEFDIINKKQNEIIDQLVEFVESQEKRDLDISEKQLVYDNLNKYLLPHYLTEKYSKYISAFIIKNKDNESFTHSLNLIREGIILYQGIRYTADLNQLGKWNDELKIFLSTEHLFNAMGYNGVLFKEIFDDFYNLVSEINLSYSKTGDKLIHLHYFDETWDEITLFFQSAEYKIKGSYTLDNNKPAMKAILEGCSTPSDIQTKKIKFEQNLKLKGITLKEIKHSIYEYPEFVVEDENILEDLRNISESRGKFFDENMCREFFKIFTKINYFRGGENKAKFEKIGSIFITGNRFALHLSHQSMVKFNSDDIPFAKDIDYITNKFWFKLKKGFSDKNHLPKSFDVVTKAQIILSSQLNQSIHQEYQKLQNQLKSGVLSQDEAIERSYVLREKPSKPEEITSDNIDNSLDFLINDTYFEDLFREKEKKEILLNETLNENALLLEELNRRKELDLQEELLKKRSERKILREVYTNNEWQKYNSGQNNSMYYTFRVLFLTFLPLFIGLILKINKNLNEKIESWGNNQWYLWFGLALLFLIELTGRSYFFNKDKIKEGFIWLKIKLGGKVHSTKEMKLKEFGNDFDVVNNDI